MFPLVQSVIAICLSIQWAPMVAVGLPWSSNCTPSGNGSDFESLGDPIVLREILTTGNDTLFAIESTGNSTSDERAAKEYKVVCYFTNWAWSAPDYGSLYPEDVPAHLCTHINYAFATLDNETHTLISANGTVDFNMNFYRRVADLKLANPDLKVLLSLGGWADSADGLKYSEMVNNETLRANFIRTVIPYLRSNGFDGLDLDWEYPTCWQGNCNASMGAPDKEGFVHLVRDLRSVTNGSYFLITAAVGAWVDLVNKAYDVRGLAQYLDFVNLMTYDLYNGYQGFAVHHSSLFPLTNSTEEANRNCNATVHKWIDEGFPSERIILGVPFYGRSFTLADKIKGPGETGLNLASTGPGLPCPVTREAGYCSFTEICKLIRNTGWTVQRFNDSEAPIAYDEDQWIGFDDLTSLKRKSDYIKSLGLGGVMFWELSLDDFQAACCPEKWPLLRTMNRELNGYPHNSTQISCF